VSTPPPSRPTLRVGTVPYLVGRPLDRGLEHEPQIELSYDVPAVLVERLRAGDVDVALVSSIELFRRPGYGYLSDLAVCGRGFVASVQLFLRRPLDALRSVAVDPASRSAAALVRVLLAERPGGAPEFVELPAGADARAAGTDAWLRIGDTALREVLAPDPPPVFNPSQAWTERTGLPFIFANWIVRPAVDVGPWLPAFVRARERGARSLGELAAEAARTWELPLAACTRYLFEECVYDPGPDLHRALLAFRDAAARAGLCDGALEPRAVAGPYAPAHARERCHRG